MQLFCGSKAFSEPRYILYNGKINEKYLCINKRIYFNTKYKDIPNFASLIFEIKSLCPISEETKKLDYKTVYWVNFRLFDHTKSLKSGKIINL